MEILKRTFIAVILCFIECTGSAQDLKSVFCVGSINDRLIFSGDSGDNFENLFFFNEDNYHFEFFEKNRIQPRYDNYYIGYHYVEEEFRCYAVRKTKDSFPFAFEMDGNFEIIEMPFNPKGTGYDLKNQFVYLGNQSDNPDQYVSLPINQLNLESGELRELPIKGIDPKVIGDYLYYADYQDSEQFDLVYDIYRVKMGEWKDSEKIFQSNYMDGWKVSQDGKYLLTELIEYGHNPQKVIYSIVEKRYALINNEDLPSSVFYSKIKEAFCFYDIGLNSNGKRRFVYANVPEVFPYIPSWAMNFEDTFITPYLLDEATEGELRKLDKYQLGLLRNAIFARKGWRFQADDLINFFNQFPWYKVQLSRVENNEEIKLTNMDRYRSQLILKIEQEN